MRPICHSDYLHSIFIPESLNKVVKTLVKLIKTRVGLDNFDAIAYRGMSGAGVATTVGHIVKKPLIMIRKTRDEESYHSSQCAEGVLEESRIIIIDDCISSGSTVVKMAKTILKAKKQKGINPNLKVVAILLYNDTVKNYELRPCSDVSKFADIFSQTVWGEVEFTEALKTFEEVVIYGFKLDSKESKKGIRYSVIGGNRFNEPLKTEVIPVTGSSLTVLVPHNSWKLFK